MKRWIKVLIDFWEVYLIGIGIGLIVTGLSLLSPKPLDLLIAGFIILAMGSITFALNRINKNGNR